MWVQPALVFGFAWNLLPLFGGRGSVFVTVMYIFEVDAARIAGWWYRSGTAADWPGSGRVWWCPSGFEPADCSVGPCAPVVDWHRTRYGLELIADRTKRKRYSTSHRTQPNKHRTGTFFLFYPNLSSSFFIYLVQTVIGIINIYLQKSFWFFLAAPHPHIRYKRFFPFCVFPQEPGQKWTGARSMHFMFM